jgi:hypothetical protein
VRLTLELTGIVSWQLPEVFPDEMEQLMPDGLLVTVPLPVPNPETVRTTVGGLNVAVTVRSTDIVTWQGLVAPLHAPPQPPNVWSVPVAAAVRVTFVLTAYRV